MVFALLRVHGGHMSARVGADLMARSKVRVEFNRQLARNVVSDAALRGVRFAVIEGQNLTRHVLGSEYGQRTGKLYPRGKTETHQASAPGEAPAPDTGTLRRSTQIEVFSGPSPRGVVTVNAEYAAALELGTEKMAPRPFLSRVLNEFGGRIRAAFNTGARGA